ncbi:MAG: hypothetical protein EXR08_00285 [Alphaproteobacteria bacterium]|nr:hypothetical protein [Alphaproteobacteria bacterium]
MTDSKTRQLVVDIPVSMFAAVLGVAGLGIAWRKAAPVTGAAPWIGEVLIFTGVLLFAWIAAAYGLKIARAPAAMREEANDLKRVAFFATVPMSLQLFAAGALPLDPVIAMLLWIIGTAAQICLLVIILMLWMQGGHTRRMFQPSLFLPTAGVLLGPATGYYLGFIEISWMMFSLGLLVWLFFLAMLFDRLFFDMPLADEELPQLAISASPPALAFMSYIALNQHMIDGFARFLFYATMLFVMLTLAHASRLARLRFSLAWWSFTFPSVAVAGAAMDYGGATGSGFPAILCMVLLAMATAIVSYCSACTLKRLYDGSLFRKISE